MPLPRLFSTLLICGLCSVPLCAQEDAPAASKPAASATPATSTPAAPDAKPAEDPAAQRQTLLQMIRWDHLATGVITPENPRGLKWEFEPTNNVKDTAKGQSVGMKGKVYGAPTNNTWDVIVWGLGKPTPGLQYHDVWVNRPGVLWKNRYPSEAQEAEGGEGAIGFSFTGAKGEGYRYMLLSSDKKTAIYGIAVPFPIEQKQNKCDVELRLGSKDGRLLVIVGKGFPASQPVHLTVTNGSKTSEQNIPADAKGIFVTGLMPPGTADETGTRELNFTSTAGACSLHFSQPWGKGTYHHE